MKKIVFISDTHDRHAEVIIPECDLLIFAGDMTTSPYPHKEDYVGFNRWLSKQPAKHKVVIAGNHDVLLQQQTARANQGLLRSAFYLQDSGVTIDGLKIYGSPWTPNFYNWVFMKSEADLADVWAKIPDDTEILITHGPPENILDFAFDQHCGSASLLKRVNQLSKLKYHVFGHIHSGYGTQDKFINAAQCDEQYKISNQPVVVEL